MKVSLNIISKGEQQYIKEYVDRKLTGSSLHVCEKPISKF